MNQKPRILFYDIETTPNLGYIWGKWEQNVIAYEKEWQVLSVAYKFKGDKNVSFLSRKGQDDDRSVVKAVHALFNDADVLVAHNGDSFDQKKMKARMLFHRLKPTKQLVSVDTKKVAKRYFAFNGNGLDDLAQHLGIGRKLKHQGFDLWRGCMADDAKSWRIMEKYNRRDVVLLERVYDRFLPWIENHPNVGKILNPAGKGPACPNCGDKRTRNNGLKASRAGVRQQRSCLSCGSFFLTKYTPKEVA